jgi:aspartate/methionine/tyrosine aminotransferase
VAVAPGATFGQTARVFIRITLAAEERVVAEGLGRICAFIKANAAT